MKALRKSHDVMSEAMEEEHDQLSKEVSKENELVNMYKIDPNLLKSVSYNLWCLTHCEQRLYI